MNAVSDEIADETEVLIIGGGISGLALALATARQGIRVTVLEADDFGSGATANSLRIVHGGLRYLQTLNLTRVRRSIRARRELMRFAPDLIRPMQCRIPLSKWGIRSKLPISAACILSDILSWDRNKGLAHGDRLPATNIWKPIFLNSLESDTPAVPAAAWWDAVVTKPDRLVVRLVKCCVSAGVRVVNYARVRELVAEKKQGITGARYQCLGEDTMTTLRCKVVIDAAGHGGREFRSCTTGLRSLCTWVGAANFLLHERTSDTWATGHRARERDGLKGGAARLGKRRDFFFVPTPAGMLAGTTYTSMNPDAGLTQSVDLAFEQLLDEINRARPWRVVTESDIRHMFWGLMPAAMGASGSASSQLLQHDLIIDGARKFGLPGYFRVQGIKLTTAFELAARVVPLVRRYLLKNGPDTQSQEAPNAATLHEHGIFSLADPQPINQRLAAMTADEIENLVSGCVHTEYALTLEDLLQRRLGLLPADYPGEEVRHILVSQMAAILGWAESRTARELSEADLAIAASPASRVSRSHAFC